VTAVRTSRTVKIGLRRMADSFPQCVEIRGGALRAAYDRYRTRQWRT
jgi:hypothetical protein